MADLFEKFLRNKGSIGQYEDKAHGYFAFPKLEGELGNRMIFQGKERVIWSLNNYLGLANHPEVRKADKEAAEKWGLAYPMGARMMSGNSDFHEKLEQQLAHFVSKEDAYLLNYGYQGMTSIVDCLCSRRDVVVYDAESHACIIDGLRMAPSHRYVFKHNDLEDFEKQIIRASKMIQETGGGILVITEGVFGMAGDQGKLKEICSLKSKYDFRLLVDDAHGFGTLGPTGAGAGEEQGCQDDIDLYFSTFAKSMASIGGFIAGDKSIVGYLRYNMRSQIFAKSLPMPIVVGNLKRLELLKNHPELREKLWENVNLLQSQLKANGFNIGKTDSPVTPVYLTGGVFEATQLTTDLRENYNIFCSLVTYPVIPKGHIILRLIPTAMHTKQDIEETITAFKVIKHKLENKLYPNEFPDVV
ncbi:MAG: pyridoxal phosphate-dependent aminotransferase family protein [Chitinophagaceae bacterium]|nr:MAG: Glycine C-acetyltransferase [Bacteroidetes bacterium OLB11]MCC6448859.1 pyridoxal phosphate-dependent aminotransferase family protein [Chitinophagaceae bacterium]HMN33527.1 pyridoxal phosphate-dependent aminotransferase family protein [Chitinophagaceae bacterium]